MFDGLGELEDHIVGSMLEDKMGWLIVLSYVHILCSVCSLTANVYLTIHMFEIAEARKTERCWAHLIIPLARKLYTSLTQPHHGG